jgi:hypothetical protein
MPKVYQVNLNSGDKRLVDLDKYQDLLLTKSIQQIVNYWNYQLAFQAEIQYERRKEFNDPQIRWLYYWEE